MAIDVATPGGNGNTTTCAAETAKPRPRLLHDSLEQIPQSIRFPLCGVLSNAIFLAGFNAAVDAFESESLPAARIYSLFYCLYIPFGHALVSLLVFGWPTPYLPSLASNAPIGLTAMAVGTLLTGYLDRIQLEGAIDRFLVDVGVVAQPEPDAERSEFYCSLIVMAVTGVWTYVLSIYVNGSSAATEDKKGEKRD